MKKIKIDDYYNDGIFEMARFGNVIEMKNNMTEDLHNKLIEETANNCDNLKKEIDNLILEIKKEVLQSNPLSLLKFSHTMAQMCNFNITSEFQLSKDAIHTQRMTEYVQSILVSSSSEYNYSKDTEDPSKKYFEILNKIKEMHDLIDYFYICYDLKKEKNADFDYSFTLYEAQLDYLIRGKRYQCFEKEYLSNLLIVHSQEFEKIFGLSATDIVNGIINLEWSISQGVFSVLNKIDTDTCESEQITLELFHNKYQEEFKNVFDALVGYGIFDVAKITKWPDKFIKELSYELGECTDFWNVGEFSGWPVIDLPIQKRPFISINNCYYCFDYYSLADNIYRVIQKTVTKMDKDYSWKDNQQLASETTVEKIFQTLLPGCTTYLGNYYPINGSKKNLAENDLLVIYDNIIIVIEVKAGSFVYTSPLTDFDNHIKSYKTLIEKADHQCSRTYDYLTSVNNAIFYTDKHDEKFIVDMNDIKDIFMISVTVDNINTLAAKAEKISFLNLKSNAICIGLDDLMVYKKYFESPLLFIHYLYHRRLATQNAKLALNDELDHLGMYIKHNHYNLDSEKLDPNVSYSYFGYREELDEYFSSLYHEHLNVSKPGQDLPLLFIQIIKYLEKNKVPNRVQAATYLLDFSSDEKESFCNFIYDIVDQHNTLKMVLNSVGLENSLRYNCFINQCFASYESKRKHVLSILAYNKESDRWLFDIYLDKSKNLLKFAFEKFSFDKIKSDEMDEFVSYGRELAEKRLAKYRSTHKEKIGRNQLCPCGSGKKYKKCCGR